MYTVKFGKKIIGVICHQKNHHNGVTVYWFFFHGEGGIAAPLYFHGILAYMLAA